MRMIFAHLARQYSPTELEQLATHRAEPLAKLPLMLPTLALSSPMALLPLPAPAPPPSPFPSPAEDVARAEDLGEPSPPLLVPSQPALATSDAAAPAPAEAAAEPPPAGAPDEPQAPPAAAAAAEALTAARAALCAAWAELSRVPASRAELARAAAAALELPTLALAAACGADDSRAAAGRPDREAPAPLAVARALVASFRAVAAGERAAMQYLAGLGDRLGERLRF